MENPTHIFRSLIGLLAFGGTALFVHPPAYSASPAPPLDCEVLDVDAIQKLKPKIEFSFQIGEALQICRLRQTGEASFFLASAVNNETINSQTNLCHHTTRRLFLSHDTPEVRRFTTEPPEGRSFLAGIDTHALVSDAATCPQQYDLQYALLRGINLEQFLIIQSRFKAETAVKETALNFWRAHAPAAPSLIGVHKSGNEYAEYQAVIKSIEIEQSYTAPRITRLSDETRDDHRILATAETYSVSMLFRLDGPNLTILAVALFPKGQ